MRRKAQGRSWQNWGHIQLTATPFKVHHITTITPTLPAFFILKAGFVLLGEGKWMAETAPSLAGPALQTMPVSFFLLGVGG